MMNVFIFNLVVAILKEVVSNYNLHLKGRDNINRDPVHGFDVPTNSE